MNMELAMKSPYKMIPGIENSGPEVVATGGHFNRNGTISG